MKKARIDNSGCKVAAERAKQTSGVVFRQDDEELSDYEDYYTDETYSDDEDEDDDMDYECDDYASFEARTTEKERCITRVW